MKVVMDASPAIFLAKIRCLKWVHALFGDDIQVTSSVREETMATGMDFGEAEELNNFFTRCSVKAVQSSQRFSSALSGPDNDALALAVECGAKILICDDRILRVMAEAEGIRPVGTLGILLRAMREGWITPTEARRLVDVLVRQYGFRIGIEVYQSVLATIEAHRPPPDA